MVDSHSRESRSITRALAGGYAVFILALLSLMPAFAIAYLYFFQDASLRFTHYLIHEAAIAVAVLQSGFIAYVTWRCYHQSRESFLRWLTLAFLGFTIVYAMHGALTPFAEGNVLVFVLFGPASRLVMAACLLAGLIVYGTNDRPAPGYAGGYWGAWLAMFVLVDVLVAFLGSSAWGSPSRWIMEIAAMGILLVCALIILARRLRSPLMLIYVVALLFFVQSCAAFLLGTAWGHLWWLAHAVFAAGFMILSYGVIQAFLTSGSFAAVYSQAELMAQIRDEKSRAETALRDLQRAHEELETLAATDALTGAWNRRELEARAVAECTRSARSGTPLSVVVVDLDRFKQVNDRYGHRAGDEVLRAFVTLARGILRPSDMVGRIGGEEFALMLPDTDRVAAGKVAERLRSRLEAEAVEVEGQRIAFTASFGVAQFGIDGDDYETLLGNADDRMYRAKSQGRNRVVIE